VDETYSKDSIHKESQVEQEVVEARTKFTKEIIEFNSMVWNEKKKKELSLKDSISISVPTNLESFKKDLKAMHSLSN